MFRSLILSVALLPAVLVSAAACRAGEAPPMTMPSPEPPAASQPPAQTPDPREVMGLWDFSGEGAACRLALRIEPVPGGYGLFHERCGGELAEARLWRFAAGRTDAVELVSSGGVVARLERRGPDDWSGETATRAGLRMVRAIER